MRMAESRPYRLEGNEPEVTSLRAVLTETSSTSAASLSVRKLLLLVAVVIVVAGVMV